MTAPNVQQPPVQPPTTPPTTSGAPSTEPARVPAGNPDGGQFVNPLEYRYRAEDGVEPYLVGKTPREAAKLVEAYYRLNPMNTAPAQGNQGYQQPQPQTVARPTQDEWNLTPGQAFEREMAYREQNTFAPAIQQTWQGVAETARTLAEMKYSEDFKRYGPEIDLQLRGLPPNQRTMQAYDFAVKLVRGEHAHEIQQERINAAAEAEIQRRMAAGSVVRPDGSGMGGVPAANEGIRFDSDEIPESFKEACRKANVTPKDIDAFLLTTKYYGKRADGTVDLNAARKGYVEAMKRGANGGVITE